MEVSRNASHALHYKNSCSRCPGRTPPCSPLFTKYIQWNSVLQVIFVYQLFVDVFIWFEYSRNFTVLENIDTIWYHISGYILYLCITVTKIYRVWISSSSNHPRQEKRTTVPSMPVCAPERRTWKSWRASPSNSLNGKSTAACNTPRQPWCRASG